jgi:SNF2 family DNA or RNA helicase
MPATLTRNGDSLELSLAGCRGSEFSDAKEKIKDVPGRRFDFDRKLWIVPADPQAADRILKTIRPEADDDLVNWIKASMASHEESLTSPLPDDVDNLLIPWAYERQPWQPKSVNDEEFNGALPYQRAAIDAMAKRTRGILADDMGLGKTFEAISAVEEYRLRHRMADGVTMPDGPRLVIAPSSVKGSWARELNRWLEDPPVFVVDAKSPAKRQQQIIDGIAADGWVIVNWEQLRVQRTKVKTRNGGSKTVKMMKEPLFEQTDWLAVLADEVHRAKNRDSQQTQGLWRCTGEVMFGLTGTPIMNSPDELWAILRWLYPMEYHERGAAHSDGSMAYWAFYEDYVDYWEDHYGKKVITGVKNPDALRFALKDKLIRRLAKAGGRKRIYFDLPLNTGQQKLYDEAEKAMWLAVEKDIAEGNKAALDFARAAAEGGSVTNLIRIPNGAARLVRLQQVIENPALIGGADDSALMDDFEQRYQDSRPYQWVAFCKFRESCELLAERLRKKYGAVVGVYTGDTSPEERTRMEDKFQRGEIDVIVGTIGAMKEGITLTAAHLMYFLTRDFVPDINEQCEAREDRLGQQDLVRVYIPQAEATVATAKVEVINRLKESIVRTVLPKVTIEEVTES